MLIYDGPSMLDGAPIVAVLTGLKRPSQNPKTGDLAQLWILRKDVSPIDARAQGLDSSICGDCRHKDGSCYVTLIYAPQTIWNNLDSYERGMPERIHKGLRLGAYGDPLALPRKILEDLVSRAPFALGYTHQWKKAKYRWASKLLMASCDTLEERRQAKRLGYRTFRVRREGTATRRGEAICPASAEGGFKVNCSKCRLCRGTQVRAADVVIQVHGSGAGKF